MSEYGTAVAGWLDDLRHGSATTWSDWLAAHPAPAGAAPRPAASALQLELIRRLAEPGAIPDFPALADTVASTPAFGRGVGDVPLPWRGGTGFGPPPVPPEELPADQLLRVAVPVLAQLGLRLPRMPRPERPTGGRWWSRGVVVAGLPAHASSVRADLLASGLRDGGRNATRIALVAPFGRSMFDLWTQRVGAGGAIGWRRFWDVRSRAGRLPRGVDAPATIRRIAAGAAPDRVHVVIGTDPATTARQVARITGIQVSAPAEHAWERVDLRRRLDRVLGTAEPSERSSVADRVLALVPAEHVVTPHPPRRYRAWASATADRLASEVGELVEEGGYAVHGNLADLFGAPDPGVGPAVTTSADRTLALAVRAIRAAWSRSAGEG